MTEGKEIAKEPDAPELEKKFLAKLNSLIFSNIANSNLNSEMLAENIFMSKSQLNRKVKAITGMNTAAYIKQSRLSHAQVLLRDPEKSIGDIVLMCGFESASYFTSIGDIVLMCGFESASYFTKLFKEKFGMTPSDYKKEHS